MPLLLIPGPVEVSPAVLAASGGAPPSHLAPAFIAAFGAALRDMRHVWRATPDHQPFVVPGTGTLAMDAAVANLLDPRDRALVVQTGYFSDRIAEMARRRGADVTVLFAAPGQAPPLDRIADAVALLRPKVVFVTHVDTSTGVRADLRAIAALARDAGALVVADGVCATAGERCEQAAWGVDVVLTASQKAVGLPPGLALLVASPRALEARAALTTSPPLSIDWSAWGPVLRAYEEGRPAYFSTPATTLVPALAASLAEMLAASQEPADAMAQRFARHERVGAAMRSAWSALGLRSVAAEGLEANTLSALWLPDGLGPDLPARVAKRGVVVAGGLHPAIRERYFRVGHMGHLTTEPQRLADGIRAIAEALVEAGHPCDPDAGVAALLGIA